MVGERKESFSKSGRPRKAWPWVPGSKVWSEGLLNSKSPVLRNEPHVGSPEVVSGSVDSLESVLSPVAIG